MYANIVVKIPIVNRLFLNIARSTIGSLVLLSHKINATIRIILLPKLIPAQRLALLITSFSKILNPNTTRVRKLASRKDPTVSALLLSS